MRRSRGHMWLGVRWRCRYWYYCWGCMIMRFRFYHGDVGVRIDACHHHPMSVISFYHEEDEDYEEDEEERTYGCPRYRSVTETESATA